MKYMFENMQQISSNCGPDNNPLQEFLDKKGIKRLRHAIFKGDKYKPQKQPRPLFQTIQTKQGQRDAEQEVPSSSRETSRLATPQTYKFRNPQEMSIRSSRQGGRVPPRTQQKRALSQNANRDIKFQLYGTWKPPEVEETSLSPLQQLANCKSDSEPGDEYFVLKQKKLLADTDLSGIRHMSNQRYEKKQRPHLDLSWTINWKSSHPAFEAAKSPWLRDAIERIALTQRKSSLQSTLSNHSDPKRGSVRSLPSLKFHQMVSPKDLKSLKVTGTKKFIEPVSVPDTRRSVGPLEALGTSRSIEPLSVSVTRRSVELHSQLSSYQHKIRVNVKIPNEKQGIPGKFNKTLRSPEQASQSPNHKMQQSTLTDFLPPLYSNIRSVDFSAQNLQDLDGQNRKRIAIKVTKKATTTPIRFLKPDGNGVRSKKAAVPGKKKRQNRSKVKYDPHSKIRELFQ